MTGEEVVVANSSDEQAQQQKREAFVDKVFQAVLGAQLVQTAYLGHKCGWYEALSKQTDDEGMTPLELAEVTNTSVRYAQEWLEQQSIAGWIECLNPTEPEAVNKRRYVLPKAHAGVLTDVLANDYMMPLAVIQAGWGKDIDKMLEAYKTDGGVSWSHDMTNDAREQQAAQNRPFFLNGLPQILEDSLRKQKQEGEIVLDEVKLRVADIGAGYGWSSIGIAKHFPNSTVDAFDLDAPSIEQAKHNIKAEGLESRVNAYCVDAATVLPPPKQQQAKESKEEETNPYYDLVVALECIHDMNDPITVLKTMRLLSGDTGTVIVMDERVADSFEEAYASKDPVEQVMYGFSCMCCLADGKSTTPSVATGTVMRPNILRMYSQQAGFKDIEILPAHNDFFRFYKLVK